MGKLCYMKVHMIILTQKKIYQIVIGHDHNKMHLCAMMFFSVAAFVDDLFFCLESWNPRFGGDDA